MSLSLLLSAIINKSICQCNIGSVSLDRVSTGNTVSTIGGYALGLLLQPLASACKSYGPDLKPRLGPGSSITHSDQSRTSQSY